MIAPIVALAFWGLRLLRHQAVTRWWLRLAAVPPLLMLAGAMLAAVPAPAAWPLGDGLGGFAGALVLAQASLLTGLAPWMLALAAGGLGVVALSYALGISRASWREALWARGRGLAVLGRGLLWLTLRIYAVARVLFVLPRGRGAGLRREPRFTERDLPEDEDEQEDEIEVRLRAAVPQPLSIAYPAGDALGTLELAVREVAGTFVWERSDESPLERGRPYERDLRLPVGRFRLTARSETGLAGAIDFELEALEPAPKPVRLELR